jgi:hypothetical protein
MIAVAPAIENLSLNITEEIHVRSSLTATFAALLEEMGPSNEGANSVPMPMILEPWPGGRWFRDLGNNNGHLWGHVQAIKQPTLLEITATDDVVCRCVESAIPAQRDRRRDVDHAPSHRTRFVSRRVS